MERQSSKFTLSLLLAILVAMTTFGVEAKGQDNSGSQPELSTPLEPLRPGVAEGQLFDELDFHNQLRKAALLDYTAPLTIPSQLPIDIDAQSDFILQVADQTAADLIVLAVPANHRFSERFVSTNSYRVVCGAHCPVLTVHAETERGATR